MLNDVKTWRCHIRFTYTVEKSHAQVFFLHGTGLLFKFTYNWESQITDGNVFPVCTGYNTDPNPQSQATKACMSWNFRRKLKNPKTTTTTKSGTDWSFSRWMWEFRSCKWLKWLFSELVLSACSGLQCFGCSLFRPLTDWLKRVELGVFQGGPAEAHCQKPRLSSGLELFPFFFYQNNGWCHVFVSIPVVFWFFFVLFHVKLRPMSHHSAISFVSAACSD